VALARRAHKNARERTPTLKGLLRIRRYQQETPCALQEAEIRSWLRFGEAYSALRDWRPIPAALLSHSVLHCSGTEDNPSNHDRYSGRPHREKHIPTNQRSIRKNRSTVKYLRNRVVGQFEALWKSQGRLGDARSSLFLQLYVRIQPNSTGQSFAKAILSPEPMEYSHTAST